MTNVQTQPALSVKELERKSILYRRTLIQLIHRTKAGHTGGSLSSVDLLNVLYNHTMNITPANFASRERDHYVHSKGHSVESLYAVLADKGFFPYSELETVEQYGSHFTGHPTKDVPGVEQNTGALGHGLPLSVGMAIAIKKNGREDKVFTIMGDGELAEGSIWEASASAAHYKLDNLTAIIDRNTLQISGRTVDVMSMEPLKDKLEAFGFAVKVVNGNSIPELIECFDSLPFEKGKPNAVIANTIKGRGFSFTEDKVAWHHKVPTDAELAQAMVELDQAEEKLEAEYVAA